MPKKIVNPLTIGLPAKILFHSYIQPQTGYSLAKKIYKIEKYPPTSKIYSWCKLLIEQGYLEKGEKGYRTKSDKILDAIENVLKEKGISFTPIEKRFLTKLLDSEKFRKAVSFSSPKDEFNIIETVCTFLVQTTVPIMFRRKLAKEEREEVDENAFDKLIAEREVQLPEHLQKIFKKIGMNRDAERLLNAFTLLELLPDSLLLKFEKLDENLCMLQYLLCLLMSSEEDLRRWLKQKS